MNYLYNYPDGFLRFYDSNMILNFESDVVYIVLSKFRSREAAWLIFGNEHLKVSKPMNNTPIHVMCNKIKNVMSSNPKSETYDIYMGGQWVWTFHIAYIKLGHHQPPTGAQFHIRLFHDKKNPRHIYEPKNIQRNWYALLLDARSNQTKKSIWYEEILLNKANYFTKHHMSCNQQKMQYKYLNHTFNAHSPQNYAQIASIAISACKGVLLCAYRAHQDKLNPVL